MRNEVLNNFNRFITPGKPTQAGIVAHYATIARETGFPLIVYNIPGRTASNILPETLAQLAFVYPSRALTSRPDPNRALNAIVIASILLQPAIVLLPGMRRMLGLEWIDATTWGWVAGGVFLSWLFAQLYTRRARARSLLEPHSTP